MNYGLYLSASGVQTGMYRFDVAANNLANVNTTGFKVDVPVVRQRDAVRAEDGLSTLPSNDLLERLGGGVLLERTGSSFKPGPLRETGNSLDLAIDGDGFFVIDSGQGSGADRFRYTRDGSLTLNARGVLVTAISGEAVLDTQNRSIEVDPALPVSVGSRGEIIQNGEEIARLQVTGFADPRVLTKSGTNQFRLAGGPAQPIQDAGLVRSGVLENSGVEPISAMTSVTKAQGAVSANTRMIQMIDGLMDRAINTFGRLS